MVQLFDSIPVLPEKKKIYRRLGFQAETTSVPTKQEEEFERYIDESCQYLHLRGVGLRLTINQNENTVVTLSNGTILKGTLVSSLLHKTGEVLLMGVTGGDQIIKEIKSSSNTQNLTRAVVFDAVASETVDACLKWIQNYFNNQVLRENKRVMTKRISCGYGDFTIEHQKLIYNLLDMKQLDVTITKDFILIPEKSVTALTGITETAYERTSS